jgi:2'-5' RNA ligase
LSRAVQVQRKVNIVSPAPRFKANRIGAGRFRPRAIERRGPWPYWGAMIRLFTAIPAPPEIAEGLTRRQQGLPGARWSAAETLHVTLRFFGEVSEVAAADLDAELASVHAEPFELELSGVGVFEEGRDARAVWVAVAQSEPLRVLAGRCEAAARRAGLPPETRAYRPHMTLAYLRRPEPDRVAAWLQGHNLLKSPPFRVTGFGLYSSWLSKHGARYELERAYPLG